MRIVAMLVLAGVVTSAAAGYAATPAAAPTSRSATVPPTPTPLLVPARQPGELVRSTVRAGIVDQGAARLPSVDTVTVDVACSGVDGSTMRWVLQTAAGRPLGLAGVQDCTGPVASSTLGFTDVPTARVEVALQPDADVAAGYAIVRRG